MGGKDIGVHNLFLFQQGNRDFVASVVESLFGNFQIFDITDPRNPSPVGFWGVEELRLAELGLSPDLVVNLRDPELIADLQGFLESGFGQFPRRFLHDITISQRGDLAYLSYWDAGVVLLDIRDPSNPVFLSAAVDPGSDGEVNSHAAWPNEDGSIVVETSEDFDAFTTTGLPEKWGGVRIWDFRDPLQPILLSTFETFCSANPGDTSCDPRGVYSVHNVMVKGTLAFLSWYGNGVLVLDISDPRNPFEVARFNPVGPDFEASNGGIQDVWGIFFDKGRGFASDRNGGLYIFNLKGSQ
ncbi:MAG: hypothetical protein A2V86_12100 [Deltaproteobacteria bacterium RBG_16_49_23]|nr:MAG: hypothetical protein A2V86_12100 [Deltaproteobacteria bacterium RBG_16_49_23]